MGNKLIKSRSRTKIDKPAPAAFPRHPIQPLRSTSSVFSNFPRVIAELRHHRGSAAGASEEEGGEGSDSDEEVHCCVFAPDDESVLVTCSTPRPCGPFSPVIGVGHLRVFDINSSSCTKEVITFHSQECDISRDGELITFLTNSGRGEVALVKRDRNSRSGIADRVEKFQPCCTGMTGQALSCKFSPDARHIVSAASLDFHSMRETNELSLWNVKSMQIEAKVVLRDVTDFCGFVTCCEFSPDGQYIAVSTSKEQLCILRSKNLDVVTVLRRRCRGNMCWSVFNPTYKHDVLACCLQDGRVEIWRKLDIQSGACELRYVRERERVSRVRLYSCQYSPDGQMLAVGTSTASIIMLNSDSLEALFYLDSKTSPSPYAPRYNATVHCIAFSKSQQYVAAGYSDGMARIWAMPIRFDLKHLCRVAILHHVPASKISSLPVPSGIKTYLLNRCDN